MAPTLPFGSWPTPITAAVIVVSAERRGELAVDGDTLLWSELRPEEGGRTQLVRCRADGATRDLLPRGANARTAVHEYGGAAWWTRDGEVWFANWADQRLYRIAAGGGAPIALTPEPEHPRGDRYADADLSPDGRRIVCIREHHPPDARGAADVRNELVGLDARSPSTPEVIVTGPDFVAHPRHSPDGAQLCWVEWDHPDMPWDATRLRVRDLGAGVGATRTVAGGQEESVLEPEWQPDGSLVFISDRHGWWNLYRWDPATDAVEALVEDDAEIGMPPWTLGGARYAALPDGRIVFARWRDGYDGLAVRARDGTVAEIDTPFSAVGDIRAAGPDEVVVIAASPLAEATVARIRVGGGPAHIETVAAPRDLSRLGIGPEHLSLPEPLTFPTAGGARAHALFYPPVNPDATGPEGELPPLLVHVHGGPTGHSSAVLSLDTQYWTSRGFAVVDINYRGSSGYGRRYRNLLRESWGIVDVEDAVAAARFLAAAGRVDPRRLCIAGGSAGGFTVLAALVREDNPFAAGADYFGIAELERMALDTHKFESRYLDRLIAPLPEGREIYRRRSPLTHVDRLRRPLIVLQGAEDAVVPPNQSEMIVAALRNKGMPVAYLLFEGEQHGFRQAATIRRALEAELSFYAQMLGFDLPPAEQDIEPVVIENRPR